MTTEELELTNLKHFGLCGFGYYVLQRVRGLAEGPAGPNYQHREGVRYLHGCYMMLQLSEYYGQNPSFTADLFPKLTIEKKEKYGLEDFNTSIRKWDYFNAEHGVESERQKCAPP